jgi:Peptidase family M50
LPVALECWVTGWLVLDWLLATPLMLALVGIHEAAHAVVGTAVGMKAFRIALGFGRTIREFTVGGCRIELHAIPLGGLTYSAAQGQSWPRLRLWLSVAAGPAVNLLLAAAVFAVATPSRRLFVDPANLARGFAPITLFIMANLFLFILAAWPMSMPTSGGELRTDGWLLLTLPFYGAEMRADLRASYPTAMAMEHRRAGRHAEALHWFERARAEASDSYAAALNHAVGLQGLHRYDAARAGFLALLLRKPPLRFHHFLLLNNIAWVDMMLANPELLDEADEYSQAALKAQPKCALFQGTRGYVLLRRGSVAQGMALLGQAHVTNSESRSRAINACCRAIGYAMLSQHDEAQSMLVEARSLDGGCELLATAEQETAASRERGQM